MENKLKLMNYTNIYIPIPAWQSNSLTGYHIMKIKQLDNILATTGEALLTGAGRISHTQAMQKARDEHRKYEIRTLSPVEKAYLDTIKKLDSQMKRRNKKSDKS